MRPFDAEELRTPLSVALQDELQWEEEMEINILDSPPAPSSTSFLRQKIPEDAHIHLHLLITFFEITRTIHI